MTQPKAIQSPSSGKKTAAPKAELTLEAIAKNKERKSKAIKRKQTAIKEADSGFEFVPFYYASGETVMIRVNAATRRQMNIDQQKNGTFNATENSIVAGWRQRAVKKIQVTFGRAKIKAKDGTTRIAQRWKELSIPADATKIDAIFWVRSFGKKAGGIRIGREVIVLDSKIMRSAAGAVR